ncbi:MAG: DUF4012 domain-containing protein, partial [Acidimicrobiales bacterium]
MSTLAGVGAAHEDEIRGQLEPEPAAAVDWRRAGGRRAAWETPAVWALAIAAGVAAAFAGCHPTGTPVIDPLYTALFAAAVTLAASRAGRATVLWLGFVATAATRGKGILVAPAVAALAVAFAGAFPRRARPVVGATAGALAVEVALRWSSFGFHGATALVAAAAVLPCLASATVRLPSWGRRWVRRGAIAVVVVAVVLVIPVVVEGLATHGRVNRGIVASESALGSVSAGDAGSATTQLAEATSDFSRSAGALGAWWTAGARLVPVAAQQRQAVAGAVEVAARVTGAAKQQAANIDFPTLHYANGRIDLAQVAALQGPLQTVAGTLDTGAGRLAALRSQWLVGPIASRLQLLDAQVTKARSNADLAAAAVKAAPSLLGGEGTRHYFVAFINPAESRGLGGLIASYAELTAENGHIDLSASGDIGGLNQQLAAAGGGHISAPADYLARYGQFHPGQFFQDLSFSPDLPSVTEVISQMYAEVGHPKIDGVLVLDPRSMASMLSFTGPIDVPGLGELTASNAAETLTVGQYVAFPSPSQQTDRQAALHDALRLAFEHLTGGSLPGPRALADAFSGDARRGDLRFWSVHPQDQPLL